MRQAFFLFLLFLATTADAQKYDRSLFSAFPTYAKVVEHYAKADSNYLREQAALYEWEKRSDGWYVLKRNPVKASQAIYYQLVWSAEKRDWMRPAKRQLTAEEEKMVRQRIAGAPQARLFNICPVFGYEEYERDIRRWWTGKEATLNETECECLMQLYGGLVYRYWLFDEGKSGRWSRFDSTFLAKDVRPAALDSMKAFATRWLKTSQWLLDKRPDYLLGTSSLDTKAEHDLMTIFNNFTIWRQPQHARPYLDAVRYDTMIVEAAENTLKSCPEQAVLVVQSEHAYYPLLYVQNKLNIRTDVALVYLPLLNLGRYIDYLKQEKKLTFSVPMAHYQYQNGKIWRVKWDTTAQSWSNFTAKLPAQAMNISDYQLPSPLWTLDADGKIGFQWKQAIAIQENIAFLDLVSSQFGKRPICLAMDLQPQIEQWGLKANVRLRGLVFELVEQAEKGLPAGQFPLDRNALETNLKAFRYSIPLAAKWRYSEYQQYAHWYISALYQLASQYVVEDKDSPQVVEFFQWFYKTFPPDRYWYGTGHLIFAFLLDDVSKDSESIQHLRGFARELEQKIRWMELLPTEEQIVRRQTLRQEVGMLMRTAQELGQMELMKQWEMQFSVLFQN